MLYPRKVNVLWKQPIGVYWDSEPVLLFSCIVNNQLHTLVGTEDLTVFDTDGNCRWMVRLNGSINTIIDRLSPHGSHEYVIGTGSVTETLISPGNMISHFSYRGLLYFLDEEGQISDCINFDQSVTKLIDLGEQEEIGQCLLVASNRAGYRPCGVLSLIGENNRVEWNRTVDGGISSMLSFCLPGRETLLLSGNFRGDITCYDISGQVVWKQETKLGEIHQVLVSSLASRDSLIHVIGKRGNICILSSIGEIIREIPGRGQLAGCQFIHWAAINEIYILFVYRNKAELVEQLSGEILWSTGLSGHVHCYSLLERNNSDVNYLLVCTENTGVIIDCRCGAIIGRVDFLGIPVACKAFQDGNLSGWFVVESNLITSMRGLIFGENILYLELLTVVLHF